MPIPFHCHDCDKPTMNKNGLCDEHQPVNRSGISKPDSPRVLQQLTQKEVQAK